MVMMMTMPSTAVDVARGSRLAPRPSPRAHSRARSPRLSTRALADPSRPAAVRSAAADLMPPIDARPGSSPRLVASVSAAPATAAPPARDPSAFDAFCRANWPWFVVLETAALIGAAVSGVSSRKKRLELAALNEKLRQLQSRAEDLTCQLDWSAAHGQCTDDWPASEFLALGKEALAANEADEAAAQFEAAKAEVMRVAGTAEESDAADSLVGVAAASWLSACKGRALALVMRGDDGSLRAAVAELKGVEAMAEKEGDSSVCGLIGDTLADLGDLVEAGAYYDKVLLLDDE